MKAESRGLLPISTPPRRSIIVSGECFLLIRGALGGIRLESLEYKIGKEADDILRRALCMDLEQRYQIVRKFWTAFVKIIRKNEKTQKGDYR